MEKVIIETASGFYLSDIDDKPEDYFIFLKQNDHICGIIVWDNSYENWRLYISAFEFAEYNNLETLIKRECNYGKELYAQKLN